MADLSGAAVLFDLDGTFVDTAGDLAASMNHALETLGLAPAAVGDVRHLVGHGARRMLEQGISLSSGRSASTAELDQGLAAFLDHYGENIAVHSRPFDGAVEAISELRRRGAAIAICTNKREALALKLINALGVENLFDAIIGGDSAAAPKPDPAPIALCLQRCGASRGVFVGDSDTDLRAAKSASMPCLIVEFGYGPLHLREQARGVLCDYRALPAAVDALIIP